MNQNERDRLPSKPESPGIGSEVPPRKRPSDDDSELQREGNLGNERNRNEDERGRGPGRDRDTLDR